MSTVEKRQNWTEWSQASVGQAESELVNSNRTGHPFSWTGWDIQLTLSNDLMSYFEFSNNPSLLLIIFKILRNVWNLIKIVCWMLINGCLEHSNWCEWLVIRLCHMLGRVFRLDNDGWMSQLCLPPSSGEGGDTRPGLVGIVLCPAAAVHDQQSELWRLALGIWLNFMWAQLIWRHRPLIPRHSPLCPNINNHQQQPARHQLATWATADLVGLQQSRSTMVSWPARHCHYI